MDELEKLFNVLTRDGYYTKSFEEFQSQYNDPEYRDKVFSVLNRDRLYTKSREEFDVKYPPIGVQPQISQEVQDEFAKDPVREAVKKKRRYGICIGRWFIGIANIR